MNVGGPTTPEEPARSCTRTPCRGGLPATAPTSRAVLGASFTWLALLVGVYAADAGPPLPAMATTAAVLFPIAAWATAAHLAATSDDLRAVLTAATGRPVALLLDAVPALIWLIGAAVTGVAAATLFDPHPAPPVHWVLGLALHLLSGLVGVALALTLQALRQTRGGQTLTILAAALASALVPFPPIRPLLQAASSGAAGREAAGADDYGRAPLVVGLHSRGQTRGRHDLGGERSLALARLEQEGATRRQPLRRLGGDPAGDVQTVTAAVQSDPGLVLARLRRHQRDVPARHVGHVRQEDVDPPAQGGRERLVQVAGVDLTEAAEIEPGARDGSPIDVGGVQLHGPYSGGEGRTQGAGPAAQIDDDRVGRRQPDRALDQELGAATRHEDAGSDGDPQSAELRPAHDLLQRQAAHPPLDHRLQLGRCSGGLDQQARLVLGGHAARCPQPVDDGGVRIRRRGSGHRSSSGRERRRYLGTPLRVFRLVAHRRPRVVR